MNRKGKIAGAALAAALLASVVSALGAQAFTNEKVHLQLDTGNKGFENAIVTGEQLGNHKFSSFLGTTTCEVVKSDGTVKDGGTQIRVTPTYEGCSTSTGLFKTFTHEGCNFIFTGGKETAPDHFGEVTLSLECPEEGAMYSHVYTDEPHEHQICTYEVPEFEHLGDVTIENDRSPTHDLLISTEATIPTTRTEGGFFTCGAESQSVTYTGDTTLRAYEDLDPEPHGQQIDIELIETE